MIATTAAGSRGKDNACVSKFCQSMGESPACPFRVFSDDAWIFSENETRMKLFNNSDVLTAKGLRSPPVGSTVCVLLARIAANDDVRESDFIGELIGSDAGAISEFNPVDAANDLFVFVLRFIVANPSAKCFHVVMSPHVRPVLRQHLLTERIDFHLPDAAKPGALKAEVESTYSRKEA